MVKSSLAISLQTCLGQRWTHEDYSDFTVVVEDMEFECHRFILASCSTFLSLLLRNDMKENVEKKVVLKDIKKETFSVIINSIYKGEDGLTLDNIIDVWHATHMLGITYLFQECEEFILSNINSHNYIQFFYHAKIFNSRTVISLAQKFSLQYFENFKTSQTFIELSFEEIDELIKDKNLNVSSENVAIDAILTWTNGCPDYSNTGEDLTRSTRTQILFANVKEKSENKSDKPLAEIEENYVSLKSETKFPGDRKEKLSVLLSSSRLCIVSEDYLQNLLIHPLIQSDFKALQLVQEALLYHWKPPHYVHNLVSYRTCQDMCNIMAFVSDGILYFYLLEEKRSLKMTEASTSYTHAAATNSDLFLCCNKFEKGLNNKNKSNFIKYEYFDVTTRTFKTMAKISNASPTFFLCNQYFIFLNGFDVSEKVLHVLNINQNQSFLTIQTEAYAKSAFIHHDYIFVFSYVYPDSELQVYTLDKQTIVCVMKIPGPAENIVSFIDKGNAYVLQKNGTLWLLEATGTKEFHLHRVTNLWNFFWNLRGAVSYLGELFLFGERLTDDEKTEFTPLPGVFDNIVIVDLDFNTNAVHMTLPKSALTDIEVKN